MHGGIIVHPHNQRPAKEFYVIFDEIYDSVGGGSFVGTNGTVGGFDITKLWTDNPDLILTNAMAHNYTSSIGEHPDTAEH
jgi:hypothetical protein